MLKKKLIASAIIALALIVGVTASAATLPLKVGSKGADVMTVQTVVGVTADGSYGPMTKAAVMAWQASHNLVADGVVGPMTWAAMTATTGGTTGGTTTPGCPAGAMFNSMTGAPCGTTTTPSTLEGGAGEIDVTKTSTDVEDKVAEGDSEKVLGFKVEAKDSDVMIKNLKVTLENTDTDGSYRISDYAEKVEVYMGSTLVGSVDASDFSKDGTVYSKSITLNNAVIKEGSNKKATFYVVVEAASNIDSDDIAENSWSIEVDSVRFLDATGVVMTSDDASLPLTETFEFTDLAGLGDLKLTVSKGSGNPIAQNVEVSDTGSTDALMLEFKIKATGSDFSFETLAVALDATLDSASLSDMVSEIVLKEGSSKLASLTFEETDGDDTYTFDLDDVYTIDEGDTVTFKVYAKINDVDNFISGDSLKVSFSDIRAEDESGKVIVESGSASGEIQTFVNDVPTFKLVGTPSLKSYQTKDSAADIYKAEFVFEVTAPVDQSVFVPLDSFGFGTAGSAGVEYTASAGTVTSAMLEYSGTGDIDENNSYMVEEGSTEKFTFTVYLEGDDTTGKVAITSIWYEISDTAPNGTPEVTTGLTNFKTASVFLAE